MTALIDHVYTILKYRLKSSLPKYIFLLLLFLWILLIFLVFKTFLVLSYGTIPLTTQDIVNLRWKDTWDFIIHKN